MIRVFAFDMDGTLTQHKTPLEPHNRAVLEKLSENYTLLAVGAGSCERIHKQLLAFPMDIIGNYGLQYAKHTDGGLTVLRDSVLPVADKESIEQRVCALRERYGFTQYVGDSVEYHASGCITLPLLGTQAKLEDKLAFDPDRKRRRAFYSEVCSLFEDYNVFVGGSSSFDMVKKPYNKFYALDLWCQENGISHSEVIFVGDDYGLGGNDECVYHSDFRFLTIDDTRRLDEVLAPFLAPSAIDINALLSEGVRCECGEEHRCEIEKVVLRYGALNELPALTRPYQKILAVCDSNTYQVCGGRVCELLCRQNVDLLCYTADGFLVPDEKAVFELLEKITPDTDLVLGIGSGVINDLCKYASHQKGLPYMIVATAPSMDGYASKGCAMIFDGMKITTNANPPKAIVADTQILREAPIEMLKAGYGDIIGKYSCLCDWRLSHLINSERLCPYIYHLTLTSTEEIAPLGEKICSRDEKSVSMLMRALVTVGIAMAFMGNSRPASGSEHHLSHFFEVVGLLREEPYFPHGIDVAYSTYLTARLREALLRNGTAECVAFDISSWEEGIRSVYRGKQDDYTAEKIIDFQKTLGYIYGNTLPRILEKWQEITGLFQNYPSSDAVLAMLDSIHLPLSDFYKMYGEEKIAEAITYAKYLKDRYTVLWISDTLT